MKVHLPISSRTEALQTYYRKPNATGSNPVDFKKGWKLLEILERWCELAEQVLQNER